MMKEKMVKKIKWEKFMEGSKQSNIKPFISILSCDKFGFSSMFERKFNLSEMTSVVLNFSQDEHYYYVGFSFSTDLNRPYAFKISRPQLSASLISCTSFFAKHGIDSKQYKNKYNVEYETNAGNKLYFIKIKKNKGADK